MKKLILSVLVVMMASSTFAANWMKVGEPSDNSFIAYIDIDSVRKLNTYSRQISYFIKYDFNKAQKISDGKYYNYKIIQWKGDCENNRLSGMGYILYSKKGNNVDSHNRAYDDWQTAFPESIGESELNSACYIAGYRDSL